MKSQLALHMADLPRRVSRARVSVLLGGAALLVSTPSFTQPILSDSYLQTSGTVNASGLFIANSPGSIGTGTVSGIGTLLNLITDPGAQIARLTIAGNPSSPNSMATFNVLSGARIVVDGTPDITAAGVNPGVVTARTPTSTAVVTVDGGGSSIVIKGNSGFFNVAASSVSDSGVASLNVTNGGVIEGGGGFNDFVTLGVGGGNATAGVGTVLISGTGSRISLAGRTGVGAGGGEGQGAQVDIGRGTGTGTATVTNGALLSIDTTGTPVTVSAPRINIGSNQTTATGTLNITGPGSRVVLTSDSLNPFVNVGVRGTGTLNVTNGGLLQINANGAASAANPNGATLNVGGASGQPFGGTGVATVSGTGSRIEFNNGPNTFLIVGRSTGANGSLTIENGGAVTGALGLLTGIDGGTGFVNLNNGRLELSGIQEFGTTPNTGPALVIGRAGGNGTVSMSNGAVVTLNAPSTPNAFTAVSLGGTSTSTAGGTGTLNMSSGATLTIAGGNPQSGLFVGRIGTGNMAVTGAGTTVDVSGINGGGRVFVGVEPFGVNTGTGTLTVANNGFVNAGSVLGVAHNGVTSSGGTGSLIVNSGGTVRASNIYVGNQGVIAGNGGTLIGNVISNQGFISPGLSPGRLNIQGGYQTVGSSRFLLEIQSDGLGGFLTDSILFKGITAAELMFAGSVFEFSFLGDTNPLAFLDTAFDTLSQFFLYDNGGGVQGIGELASLDALFGGVTFAARADQFTINSFTFTAADGFTSINVTPVPEAGTSALLLIGLVALGWLLRRRSVGR